MTHIYIQAIKQPTLHYLTRSVRRQAATSKHDLSRLKIVGESQLSERDFRGVGRFQFIAAPDTYYFFFEWPLAIKPSAGV